MDKEVLVSIKEALKKYESYVEGMEKADTFAALDTAYVEGLKAYYDLARKVISGEKLLQHLQQSHRARLTANGVKRSRQVLEKARNGGESQKPTDETPVSTQKPTESKTKTKKAVRKAKK